jgi:hypothetical protein
MLYQIWDPLLRITPRVTQMRNEAIRSLEVIDALVRLDAIGANKLNGLAWNILRAGSDTRRHQR